MRTPLLPVLAGLLFAPLPGAQEPPRLTFDLALSHAAQLQGNVPAAHWLPGGHDLAIVQATANGEQLLRHTFEGGEPTVLATAQQVRAALGETPGPDPKLPQWSFAAPDRLRIQHGDAIWHWQLGSEKAERVLAWQRAARLLVAPGDGAAAFVQDHDIVVTMRDGSRRRITWDGSPDVVYGDAAHRAEFGITAGMVFSGDGRHLAFYREDQQAIAPYPYQDLDRVPPSPRAGRYPMAGRAHSSVRVGIYDLHEQDLRWLQPVGEPDSYWTNLTFGADHRTLCAVLVNRGQDRLALHRFEVDSGRHLGLLLEEQQAKWIEPEHGPTFLADGRFVWWSSRDGFRHLYLHDADGKLLGQVTRGAFDVQELLGVLPGDRLCFAASGEDPRQRHLFVCGVGGGDLRQLSHARGTHDGELSPDGLMLRDVHSNLGTPPQSSWLQIADGAGKPLPAGTDPRTICQLPPLRTFQVTVPDGPVLYGAMVLPFELPEGRRHPVLLYVYGGPHVQLVRDRWLGGASPWLHALAAEGYVVAFLDNRGTPNRGLAFEQALHRQLGTLEVQDQLLGLDWLAQQPFVDGSRIGVHGWSYGGYLTLRLMLLAPERFRCGISGAPVTDWAMYETGYTERYLDTPAENPDGYQAASCLPLAGRLQGRLLLVHGTDDRTVMWSHSLAFVDRCIEAGVDLDYLPYPMQLHGLTGKDRRHFLHKLRAFLHTHLKPGG